KGGQGRDRKERAAPGTGPARRCGGRRRQKPFHWRGSAAGDPRHGIARSKETCRAILLQEPVTVKPRLVVQPPPASRLFAGGFPFPQAVTEAASVRVEARAV